MQSSHPPLMDKDGGVCIRRSLLTYSATDSVPSVDIISLSMISPLDGVLCPTAHGKTIKWDRSRSFPQEKLAWCFLQSSRLSRFATETTSCFTDDSSKDVRMPSFYSLHPHLHLHERLHHSIVFSVQFPIVVFFAEDRLMEAHLEEQQPMSATEGCHQEPPRKCGAGSVQSANGCFDCNICLEFAADPVVTLCGHLYCWPCMYKWLEVESTTPQQCPVCKATLSETTLVPLYGRGKSSTGDEASCIGIPRRPSILHRGRTLAASLVEPDFSPTAALHRRRRHRLASQQQRHDVPPPFGSATVAVLPWVFGDNVTTEPPYSNRYHHLVGYAGSPGRRRQEMLARRSLHRIFVFLFCCTVLCLILF